MPNFLNMGDGFPTEGTIIPSATRTIGAFTIQFPDEVPLNGGSPWNFFINISAVGVGFTGITFTFELQDPTSGIWVDSGVAPVTYVGIGTMLRYVAPTNLGNDTRIKYVIAGGTCTFSVGYNLLLNR